MSLAPIASFKGRRGQLFLKHRAACGKIATGEAEWGIVAKDDIVFRPLSEFYSRQLLTKLPSNFDYIDIAGGCGMLPRANNSSVNNNFYFYRIDSPSTRIACRAFIARRFATLYRSRWSPVTASSLVANCLRRGFGGEAVRRRV
jgi:hypothetical protein